MVNQRQQLKDSMAAALQTKIEHVQGLLTEVKLQETDVLNNFALSKRTIRDAANNVLQRVTLRKAQLLNEVDLLGQTLLNDIHKTIQDMYLTLGNLQSTLSNLDSFDNGQLAKLQTPDAARLQLPSRVKLTVDCDITKTLQPIDNWVVGVCNPEDSLELEFIEVVGEDESLYEASLFSTNQWLKDLEIANWLYKKNEKHKDEFQIEEDLVELRKVHHNNKYATAPQRQKRFSVQSEATDEDDSSIVCVNMVGEDPVADTLHEELSMWLKPRRDSVESFPDLLPPLIPPEMLQSTSTSSTISQKTSFLDFPGLRLDPTCWLHHKQHSADTNTSQKEVLPPTTTYAPLPYAFWLRK